MNNSEMLHATLYKTSNIKKMKKIYLTLGCLFCFGFLYAQPTPPAPIPIDGGVSLLLAAGVGYGLKRMRKK
jgi:hypothetical protein